MVFGGKVDVVLAFGCKVDLVLTVGGKVDVELVVVGKVDVVLAVSGKIDVGLDFTFEVVRVAGGNFIVLFNGDLEDVVTNGNCVFS